MDLGDVVKSVEQAAIGAVENVAEGAVEKAIGLVIPEGVREALGGDSAKNAMIVIGRGFESYGQGACTLDQMIEGIAKGLMDLGDDAILSQVNAIVGKLLPKL